MKQIYVKRENKYNYPKKMGNSFLSDIMHLEIQLQMIRKGSAFLILKLLSNMQQKTLETIHDVIIMQCKLK